MEETHTQEAHVADYLWTYLPTELQERTQNLEDTFKTSHFDKDIYSHSKLLTHKTPFPS